MPVTDAAGGARFTQGQAPDGSALVRIASPAFDAIPPAFAGGEQIPAAVRQACAAWGRPRFAACEVIIRVVRDVFVAAEGLVFDAVGGLLAYSVRQHEPELVAAALQAVRDAIAGGGFERHDLPLVLGKKRGAANYGHWMIEMLPMLHLALSRLADRRIGVLLHDVGDPALGGIMQETLRRLGIADARVRVSGMAPVFVRELILVEGLTEHGTYMSPLVRDCHDRLAHGGVVGLGVERVLLLRGAGLGRRFRDDPHMTRIAASRGFSVLSPAGLGLDGQIAMMRDARVVAGVMGAAMTNLIYARAGTRALLFAPAEMPDTFFWFIATLRGLPYREVRCAQSGPGEGWNRQLDLGFRDFRRLLDQEIEASA